MKLDTRKPNQVKQVVGIKVGMKNLIPALAFHAIYRDSKVPKMYLKIFDF